MHSCIVNTESQEMDPNQQRASSVQKDVLSRNDHEEVASFPFPEISTSLSLTMNEPAQALEFLHEHQAIQSCEPMKKKEKCGSTPKQGSIKDHCFCDICVYIVVKQ
ncbi:hypothetical protein AB4K20DRAFT_1868885 [Rhizopus microsporus]